MLILAALSSAYPATARSLRSDTGPRGISGGVEVSPVDKLGPTLPTEIYLTPDSGWNSSGSGGVGGSNFSTRPALFPEPTPPPKPKHKPYIILNQ